MTFLKSLRSTIPYFGFGVLTRVLKIDWVIVVGVLLILLPVHSMIEEAYGLWKASLAERMKRVQE